MAKHLDELYVYNRLFHSIFILQQREASMAHLYAYYAQLPYRNSSARWSDRAQSRTSNRRRNYYRSEIDLETVMFLISILHEPCLNKSLVCLSWDLLLTQFPLCYQRMMAEVRNFTGMDLGMVLLFSLSFSLPSLIINVVLLHHIVHFIYFKLKVWEYFAHIVMLYTDALERVQSNACLYDM